MAVGYRAKSETRREFLQDMGFGMATLVVGCSSSARVGTSIPNGDSGSACVATTPDIEGPYYRPGIPIRSELDLYGDPGQRLRLSGVVLDVNCQPIENAIVEIWNANTDGTYDTTTTEKRYYGQTATLADGSYWFHTLLPGRYLNGAQYRPRHVHMKVWLPTRGTDGAVTLVNALTTQIYFEGDPYNEIDPWWSADRTITTNGPAPNELVGVWNVQGIARV